MIKHKQIKHMLHGTLLMLNEDKTKNIDTSYWVKLKYQTWGKLEILEDVVEFVKYGRVE